MVKTIWSEYMERGLTLHLFNINCYELYEEDNEYWGERLRVFYDDTRAKRKLV